MTLPIPTSGVIGIESQLEGAAWAEGRLDRGVGIATMNAHDTAFLTMLLPAGATFTSTSGVFLTSPIPEPQTWALMLAGIGLVAGRKRLRLRSA